MYSMLFTYCILWIVIYRNVFNNAMLIVGLWKFWSLYCGTRYVNAHFHTHMNTWCRGGSYYGIQICGHVIYTTTCWAYRSISVWESHVSRNQSTLRMMCYYIYCSCLSALSMNDHFLPIYTGPKVDEVGIFWQMVMEHKPAVVVMLTNVEENGKVWMVFVPLQLTCKHYYCMPRCWVIIVK